ncbi:CGNR zinc finger domain-containing protein [Suilimivivens sp.]|uniref:CGNR zinc finger domain-containing protein n=1 Tax=Suilimivivens sp. TaxID=2981669 RepID=UPI00307A1108
MPQIKENFFENILFKFESCSCDCVEDIEHIAPGAEPISKFKLQAIPEHPVLFGYAAKDGLVRIAPNGTIEERNILGTLMSLANKPTKELVSFMKDNGFLFPVCAGTYEVFDEISLYGIINRLKMTVELMTAANEIRKNYKKICDLTISLLFSEDLTIKTDSMKNAYSSCHHKYVNTLMNPPVQLSYSRQQEAFDGDTYSITDCIYGSYALNIQDYDNIIGGYSSIPGYQNGFYQNITSMFVNYEKQDMTKKISDFLFHFLYEMNGNSSGEFSDEMKSALIEIAKYILGEEINANLDGIHPVYNSETMTPSWKVDSLLCAAYFSIFYLKPDLELYRPCDNPRCGRFFLVKTTSTRNRFCSQACCNRVTQDRYRKRKREKEGL